MDDVAGLEAFRSFADNLPILCWVADADGYITWYNRRCHDYCGTTPQEMEGWGWTRVHNPQVLPYVVGRWHISIATGAEFEMVFPLRRGDGVFHKFLTRVRPERSEAGQVLRWYGVHIDLDDKVCLEAEVLEMVKDLEGPVSVQMNESPAPEVPVGGDVEAMALLL